MFLFKVGAVVHVIEEVTAAIEHDETNIVNELWSLGLALADLVRS